MKRLFGVCVFLISMMAVALAASGRQPAPAGSFAGAPAEYTQFSIGEISRGFLALAYGSDLRVAGRPRGLHRFTHPVSIRVQGGGSVDRKEAMRRVLDEYARKVPNLHLNVVAGAEPADVEVLLIDEKALEAALRASYGARVTQTFVTRTDPECVTSVKSNANGEIVHALSYVIVDKGDEVFLDCAYHELLHAFGLSNHDQRNPWTMLNQKRMVGYLSVYDRALLTLLYDPRIRPGMTPRQVRPLLPRVIKDLGVTAQPSRTARGITSVRMRPTADAKLTDRTVDAVGLDLSRDVGSTAPALNLRRSAEAGWKDPSDPPPAEAP
jgi:hypothetical protein